MSTTGLILFGIGVGVLSGTFGIGGGIILVPGLVLLFGFSQLEAQGTSLAVLAMPICLFAALVYYQNGHLRLPTVGWIALGFVLGAYAGARLAPHLPITFLRLAFAVLLLYVGFDYLYDAACDARLAQSKTVVGLATAALVASITSIMHRRRDRSLARSPQCDWENDYDI